METLYFDLVIDAPPAEVSEIMLGEETFKEWTAAFQPTSRYEGNWEEGSKMLFLAENEDGKTGGMFSRVREHIPHKYISVEHLGMVKDGKEISSGPEVDSWAGAMENYSFEEMDGKTVLKVSMDCDAAWKEYFQKTWPKALANLREICERQPKSSR